VRQRYSYLSDAICPYCRDEHYKHERRCRTVRWHDGEVQRCLWDQGHESEHGYRASRHEKDRAA
jgi:hypothetical protein